MTFVRDTDVAVIGAGPGGLSAALAAAHAGVRVTVIDEYPQPGGQFYKQLAPGFTVKDRSGLSHDYTKADELLARVKAASVELMNDALVWTSFEPGVLNVRQRGTMGTIRFRALVVATGAYERPAVFPGWDLPGVMTPGGAQTLVKTQRILPGKRIVLAGSGPFLMPVATTLLEARANIIGIYEATTPGEWARHAPRLWGHWARLGEALRYSRTISRAGVPVRFGYAAVRAEGDGGLERVILMRCERDGRPVPGSEVTEDADVLCASYGFVPAVQLTSLLGCEHHYDADKGGWVPLHDESMQTTVPGVFVAGEIAGIGGAHAAMAEGALAGLNAARGLGRHVNDAEIAAAARARKQHRAFAALVSDVFAIKPRVHDVISDDTLVCRCEEVTAGEIRRAAAAWGADANYVKGVTRCGMGYCQGRICGSVVEELTARALGGHRGEVARFRVRLPLKPVTVGELAQLAEHDTGSG